MANLVPLEVLDLTLMLLGGFASLEGPKIPSLADLGIYFARIKPILSGFQFAYHSSTHLGISMDWC